MENLQTLALLLGLYGALWLANTVLAIRNNLHLGDSFDWGKFWDGVLKAGLGAGALTVGAVAISFLPEVLTRSGFILDEATAQAVSVVGLLASVGAGVIVYARKFVKNVAELFSDSTSQIDTEIVYDENDPSKATVIYMDKTGEATDRQLMIEKLLATKVAKQKGIKTEDDVNDGTVLPENEVGRGSGDTYPSYWKNVPKDSVVDRYTCYNRECVSYCGWKVEEAYGYILPRGGSMNAKEWVKYAGLWGVQLTNEAGVGSVGVSTAGEYGHVFWVEEVHANGTITVSEYNYAYNGNYNRRTVGTAGYRFLRFDIKYGRTVVAPPAPAPAPTPQASGSTDGFNVGDTVTVNNPVDTRGVRLATNGNYTVMEINRGSVVIGRGGVVTARILASHLTKVGTSAPAPAPAPAPTSFNVGDVVAPTRLVDYNGNALTQWDNAYTITELNGDRAVLSARGAVWAAMRVSDLRRA